MCGLQNILCMTTKKAWLLDGQTPDKVIPMCHYASQATQPESIYLKLDLYNKNNLQLEMCQWETDAPGGIAKLNMGLRDLLKIVQHQET